MERPKLELKPLNESLPELDDNMMALVLLVYLLFCHVAGRVVLGGKLLQGVLQAVEPFSIEIRLFFLINLA